ncbi:MAG: acyltransferase [Candidatus Didemnitutus sp.]|nr:acyltransferase [Candidatus Didemnitutus sp.]
MLASSIKSLLRWLAVSRLRLKGVQITAPRLLARGIDCQLGVARGAKGEIAIADGARIERGVVLHAWGGSIRLGRDIFLGPHTVIYGHGGVLIGDACLIAMHCRILSSNHAVPPLGTDIRSQPDELRATRIGRDVWLGAGVTIVGGVTLGDGCIVGAGSVVTHDLPAGAIALGVPARITGTRAAAPPSPASPSAA